MTVFWLMELLNTRIQNIGPLCGSGAGIFTGIRIFLRICSADTDTSNIRTAGELAFTILVPDDDCTQNLRKGICELLSIHYLVKV